MGDARETASLRGIRIEEHPSGAKAHVDLIAFAARLKTRPFKAVPQWVFSAHEKAHALKIEGVGFCLLY
jgi:hypothetical protein